MKISPVIYRHVRPDGPFPHLASKGGFTLAFQVHYNEKNVVGIFAFKDDEKFVKEIGNDGALESLNANTGFEIPWVDYDQNQNLVLNAINEAAFRYFLAEGKLKSKTLEKFCIDVCQEEILEICEYVENQQKSRLKPEPNLPF